MVTVTKRHRSQQWCARNTYVKPDPVALMIDPRQGEIDRLVSQSREFARETEIAMRNAGRATNAKDRSMHLAHAAQFRAISEAKAETAAEMVRRYGKQLPLPLPPVGSKVAAFPLKEKDNG